MPKPVPEVTTLETTSPLSSSLLANLRSNNVSTKSASSPLTMKEWDKTSTWCSSTFEDASECSMEKIDKSTFYSTGLHGVVVDSITNVKSFQQSHKYKTEICKNFEIYGFCKWGEGCCFAHGRNELRNKTLFNYFYKTKVCKHFHKNGFCPYASRCQYFHFKTNHVYQELLDSLEKKLLIRMNEDLHMGITAILDKNERSQARLPVFRQLIGAETKKSLYEKFLEDCY